MQNIADMYPPFWMSPVRVIVVIVVIAAVIAIRVFVMRLLQKLALRIQRKAAEAARLKDPQVLNQALAQLANLYNAYMRREISAAAAVEQASALVRETYDHVMNHRTRYQARYEIAARRLAAMGELVAHSYTVEFTDDKQPVADEVVEAIFTKAKGVIESCR